MRASRHRLARIRQAIDTSPVQLGILKDAYEGFTLFGELPDDDRVAFEVVQRALNGGEEYALDDEQEVIDHIRQMRLAYHRDDRPTSAWPPSVRTLLFDEALFAMHPIRLMARRTIAEEVAWGGDVESPGFAARHGIPTYGSVALHVRGWPRCLAAPPYEDQGRRLLVRLDNVRGRVPQDSTWFAEQHRMLRRFKATGDLPRDPLHFELVLVTAEMDQLIAHRAGVDVSEAMHAFQQIAHGRDAEAGEALRQLQQLASASKIR